MINAARASPGLVQSLSVAVPCVTREFSIPARRHMASPQGAADCVDDLLCRPRPRAPRCWFRAPLRGLSFWPWAMIWAWIVGRARRHLSQLLHRRLSICPSQLSKERRGVSLGAPQAHLAQRACRRAVPNVIETGGVPIVADRTAAVQSVMEAGRRQSRSMFSTRSSCLAPSGTTG